MEETMGMMGLALGIIAILVMIVILALLFRKANTVNLTGTGDEKPEWLRETPPAETLAAAKKEGKDITVFDFDKGEKLAAPFTEQIEDIFRAKLEADPELKDYKIDLGTDKAGGLEIWVNDMKYANVNNLPDERLKVAFRESVVKWNK
jgi:hypothetical protein